MTNALYAAELIPKETKDEMFVLGVTDHKKASKLVSAIEEHLEASPHPDQYLIDTCEVLRKQQSLTLTDIASDIANGELCDLY